jgi:hypothetical protein
VCARERGLEAYVLAIERQLGRRRGREVQLSPPDFQLAREWFRGGLPLAVVLAGVDEAGSASRSPSTLAACRRAVERLAGAATSPHGAGPSPPEPQGRALSALATRLEQLTAHSTVFAELAREARTGVAAGGTIPRERVELACVAALQAEEREALLSSARRALERQGRGLNPEERAAALERHLLRRALERFGLLELL